MNKGNKGSRAQSAMEYLMTYGWAILIIAVVLAVLFSLNVFNAGASLGTSCIGATGYSCSGISLSTAKGGVVSFTLGDGTGASISNIMLACVASSNSLGALGFTYNAITATGAPATTAGQVPGAAETGLTSPATATLVNSQSLAITGLACPGAPTTIGAPMTGAIWMAYNNQLGNPNQYIQVATFSAKATS